jgi:O-antigen/teichoic acid export membrane protein
VSIGACALLWVLAEPAVTLAFGGEFADAAPSVRLLCVAAAAMSIRQMPLDVLRGTGRPGLTTIAEACNWACFLVAVPLGAHWSGLSGAAAAVAVAGCVSLGVVCALALRGGAPRPHAAAPASMEALS